MRPQGLKIGAVAGKSFLTAGNLSDVSSSNFGLKAEVDFPRNWSLVAGLDWFRLSYRTNGVENLGGEIIPLLKKILANGILIA